MHRKSISKSSIVLIFSVLIFLLLSTSLIHFIKSYGQRAINTFVPQTDLVMEVKLELASTHLWLEEYLNGDTSSSVNVIMDHLDNVRKFCWLLSEGGYKEDQKVFALSKTDIGCQNLLPVLCEKVKRFDKSVRKRIQLGNASIAGTKLERDFDNLYRECFSAATAVEKSLFKDIEKEMKYFDRLQILLILVLVIFSICYSIFLVWNNKIRLNALMNTEELNVQLKASNQQLQASEQQLRAINQQFMASEQQLQATNQQLQANEQQLKATNQQLQASEQQLKATNQQLKASEQLLVKNEEKYRSLFENMVEGAALHQVIYNKNGKAIDYEIIEVNKSYTKIMDKDEHFLLNKRGAELSSDGTTIPYLPIYAAVAETSVPFFFETYLSQLKKHVSISVYSPSKGNFVTTISDITDKKKNEEEIRILADQNNTILKTINDVIIEIDLDKKFCWGNRAANEFFIDNYIGREFESFIIENDDPNFNIKIEELIADKKDILHFEVTVINRFNKYVRQLWWMKAIHDSSGNVSKILGTARDITEQRNIEERLRHTEKMEAIGQLAGGIAHDFNNQLSGMMGYADILREEVGHSPDLSRYTDNILLAIRRSAELTSQLLAFARKGKYRSISVDLHKIIFETVGILQRSIEKNIHIKQELNANNPITLGDPTQIENVLLNLAINARDALPKGGEIKITSNIVELDNDDCLNLFNDLTPGKYIKVGISDNGVGMDEETKAHIFEPFYTTKELGKGTGMGLAAVYGTMENHKGTIEVDSTKGIGTVFHIYLPLNLNIEDLDSMEDNLNVEMAKEKAHILFVDDEEMLCDMADLMFKGLGYSITTFSNSAKALEFYKENYSKVDLVILDMVMPIMDGKDLFNAMKRINPDIISLLASGYSIDGKAQSILDDGAKGFIQKPFRKASISKIISETISIGN